MEMLRKALQACALAGSLAGLAACGGRSADEVTDMPPIATPVVVAPVRASASKAVTSTIERVLETGTHPNLKWGTVADVAAALKPWYGGEADRLLWFDGRTPEPALARTIATIAAADEIGLDPADYDAALLVKQQPAVESTALNEEERALFDLAVSVAAARMLRATHVGRVDPATMGWGYDVAEKQLDLAARFGDVRRGIPLGAALQTLEPPFTHFARARNTLAAYKTLAKAGEPEAVPDLPKGQTKVEPGKTWTGVPQLAARLRVFGDLGADVTVDGGLYKGPLVDAVKKFQARHALEPDGVIGAGTIRTINMTLAHRVRQIELAMERMRWLPKLDDRPNIFVNIPLFRLWATDPVTGEEPLRMNVVVGKSLNSRTPIFVEQMEYVIFRPYWNPPYSITKNEIIPRALRDPRYFDKENLEIVASGDDHAAALPVTPQNLQAVTAGRLHVRQRPGPDNSLGLAKFMFPNKESIYMHGTPAQQLFSRARRDFSHGCIRLEDPARFAEWLLRDNPAWPRAKIDAAMQGTRPIRVNLTKPLTVVIFYDTVHVNSEGVIFFMDDIYGHDRELDAALRRGYPYPVKTS
jgi:L,D-transpeptidase YcbB